MPDHDSAGSGRIAAIVATCNRSALLRRALDGLSQQTLDRHDYEVIVVDDGSTDETRRVSEHYIDRLRFRYVYQRPAGLAAARNLGIFSARSPILLFLDDDDVADARLLEEHLRAHTEHPDDRFAVLGYTALEPAIVADPLMHFVTNVACLLFSYPDLRDGDLLDYSYFWGGRSSCKRAFLIDHGVFNPLFRFGCEDIELAFRLSRHGFKVVYTANAVTTMVRLLTLDEFCDRLFRQGRSSALFSRLHPDDEVQRWCETAGADARWAKVALEDQDLLGAARRLDRLARVKRALGFNLTEDDTRWLHRAYWAACRAAKLRGIHEGRTPLALEAPRFMGSVVS